MLGYILVADLLPSIFKTFSWCRGIKMDRVFRLFFFFSQMEERSITISISKMIHKESFLAKGYLDKFVKHKQCITFVFQTFCVISTAYRCVFRHLEFGAKYLFSHYHMF
jgi:hypothetical protein